MKAIKCITRSTNTLTLITVSCIIKENIRKVLLKHSDVYLKISQVGKGYSEFTGVMSVLKEVQVGTIRNQLNGNIVWGLKKEKR